MAADSSSSSSRKAPGSKPQFLKVLFMEFMEKMPIPAKFMRRHLAAEPGLRRATLVSPLKKFWHVDVVRDGDDDDVYFASGWVEFVRANGLEEENFLVFRYEGNMVFTVKVFETSGCIKDFGDEVAGAGTAVATLERTAPRKRPGTGSGSQTTSKTHSGTNANKTRKISEKKLTGDGDIPAKNQCRSQRIMMEDNDDEQNFIAEKNIQADTHSDSGIATEVKESDYTSILPVYSKVATPCNIRYSYMNIGKKFCNANGITSNRLMILKDSGGRSWPVKLTLMSDQVRMKSGWSHFSNHHGIKVGDLCFFHLVDENTFNVSIKRAP
uniref:Uncharacterized protein n=1 Tax=Avena sativa TaxID=4498 RepID=A0ACD5X8D9_AVESA